MDNNGKVEVVAMCCDGLFQRYLIERLASEFKLTGVIVHATPNAKGSLLPRTLRHKNPVDLFRYIQTRRLMSHYEEQARPAIERLFYSGGRPPSIPEGIPTLEVENINDPAAVTFLKNLGPDVICINGTNLLRKPMLDVIPSLRLGAINLHTGLSPYSRGGNCNLYMLLEGHPEFVGLTIHYIDPGVDSGDIIISSRPKLEPEDTYETIDAKTFRLGIDLMMVAIRQLQEGKAERVKQWERGKLFLRKTGYVYSPHQRVHVNSLLKKGLIRDYLANQAEMDAGIRLVGEQGA